MVHSQPHVERERKREKKKTDIDCWLQMRRYRCLPIHDFTQWIGSENLFSSNYLRPPTVSIERVDAQSKIHKKSLHSNDVYFGGLAT